MRYLMALIAVLVALVSHAHGYWDMPWSAVHDRPVFRITPPVKWSFNASSATYTYGMNEFLRYLNIISSLMEIIYTII
jgi:hypothetical protein